MSCLTLCFLWFFFKLFLNFYIWLDHQNSLNNFLMISLELNLVNCTCILANLYVRYKTFLQPQGVLQSARIMPSEAKVTSLNLPSPLFLGPNLSKINKKIFFILIMIIWVDNFHALSFLALWCFDFFGKMVSIKHNLFGLCSYFLELLGWGALQFNLSRRR